MKGLTICPGVDWLEGYLAAKSFVAMNPEPCEAIEDYCPTKTAKEKQKPPHIRIQYELSENGKERLNMVIVSALSPPLEGIA